MLPVVPDEEVAAVAAAVARGLVVGLPTDTVYGLGAAPWSQSGVVLLFEVKRRPAVKPIPILAASIAQAERIGRLEGPARAAAERHWPGALTVIVPRAPGLPGWVGDAGRDSVGLRVPDHPRARALLEAAGPLAVTSANRTGADPVLDAEEARAIFGDEVAAYLAGRASGGLPSTVVDFTGRAPRVLRPGPVPWAAG